MLVVSTKLQKVLEMKTLIKELESELKPLIEDVKSAVLQEGMQDKQGNWILEDSSNRAMVVSSIRVSDLAVPYLEHIKRPDLIATKSLTTFDLLLRAIPESLMIKEGLASYLYTLRVNPKRY